MVCNQHVAANIAKYANVLNTDTFPVHERDSTTVTFSSIGRLAPDAICFLRFLRFFPRNSSSLGEVDPILPMLAFKRTD